MSERAKSARAVALDALCAFETSRVFSSAKLSRAVRAAGLDRRDAAFASFLVGGVLQTMLLLDWQIARFSRIPLKKLEKRVLCALRLGAFQIFFADGVPARAAVGETVELIRSNRRAAGFCNAVLRALMQVEDPYLVETGDTIEEISIRRSCPEWIVREAVGMLGEREADELLAASNIDPPVTMQLNPLRTTREQALEELASEGESVRSHPFLSTALELDSAAGLSSSAFMARGGGWVQDAASFLAVAALAPEPGDRVLDICAAPGGKTFAASALTRGGCSILAQDISARKLQLVAEGAARLGFSGVETSVADATMISRELVGRFDKVICDLPCSGLGILRKKPDIRYRSEGSARALGELQTRILENAAAYLAPGGRMLYSTCTWRRAENEDIVRKFLAEHTGFSSESFSVNAPNVENPTEMLTLMPHKNETDGFFICLLRKSDV